MRRFLAGLLLLALSVVALSTTISPVYAQIPAEVLKDIKAATVFVKVYTTGGAGTGSGFLIHVNKDSALIATNEHVIAAKKTPGQNTALPPPTIEVVFDSGRKTERVFSATVLAADADRDLAILQIKNVKDMPKPLDISGKFEVVETMTTYMVGFPFGTMLSTNKGNPALTIGRGTVSSIREDNTGKAKYVQIDGDINPGNSGGPVVDSKGRLVGVAVAKLVGTNIGLAIPPSQLTALLGGNIQRVAIRSGKADEFSADLIIEVELLDPLYKIRKASARVVAVDKLMNTMLKDKDGIFLPLPNAEVVELKIENQKCVGSFTAKADGHAEREYRIQPVYGGEDNALVHAEPTSPYRITFTRSPPVLVAGSNAPPKSQMSLRESGSGLARTPRPIGEVRVTDLNAAFLGGPACLCWTADATAFYHLDSLGTVRRIRIPDGKETAILKTGKNCTWLCRSALGLVLTVLGANEIWLLDPETLQAVSRIPVGDADHAVSSPNSEMAYATGGKDLNSTLSVIDLRTEKIDKQYKAGEFGKRNPSDPYVELRLPVMTSDGRFIFTVGSTSLHRFKVSGSEITFEETSPHIIQGPCQGICISSGGDYVCAPSGGGNWEATRFSKTKAYSTYIIPIGSLGTCELVLGQGAYPQAVGFDLQSGLLYAQNHDTQLLIFDTKGEKLKELRLDPGKDFASPRQYLVHPEGRKLVVMTDPAPKDTACKLWYVEFPIGRKWIDSSGKFSVEADLIEVKDGNVFLRTIDGKKLSIPLDKLSAADRLYLTMKAEKKPAGP